MLSQSSRTAVVWDIHMWSSAQELSAINFHIRVDFGTHSVLLSTFASTLQSCSVFHKHCLFDKHVSASVMKRHSGKKRLFARQASDMSSLSQNVKSAAQPWSQ